MEAPDPMLKASMLEVVDNQLRDDDPPEAGEALRRLVSEGISRDDAKIYIAQAICVEMWDALKNKKGFDSERYLCNLKNLPQEPSEQ
jgi:hypothetical protein